MTTTTNRTNRTKTTLEDVQGIRERARRHVERGAVTEGYRADRKYVLELLNRALATELVCALRYQHHYYVADGIHAEAAAGEFLEHARQEQDHAGQIAARIVQLGGVPDFSPDGLSERSHAEYGGAESLREMIHDDLVAERIAIETYGEMVRYVGDDDPTTRKLLEEILATEEEHADDLSSLLAGLPEDG